MFDYKSTAESGNRPPKAMQYDRRYFEDNIKGYMTLNVEGRESLELKIDAEQVAIGSKIYSQQFNSRNLTVEFGILGESIEDMQKKYNELKLLLYKTEDVPISFDDEPGLFFYGRLSSIEKPDYLTGEFALGSFSIYCQNPMKFSSEKQTGSRITVQSPVETTPERIEVRLLRGTSLNIRNKNTGEAIKINGAAIYTGDLVVFDFDDGTIFVNGKDMTDIADRDSAFEYFYVHRGDILECDNGIMTIYVREVYL